MVDKTETITLLPHPIIFESGEPDTSKDSRTEGTLLGKDVWKLVAQVPWTDFPVTYLTYPRTDSTKPAIGAYRVELNRGKVKKDRDGSGNDYDYFWNAITWTLLGEQEAPAPSANGGQPAAPRIVGGNSTAEEKKDRSVALSYAKDAWCAGKIERGELIELAGLFHDAMVNGFTEEE
jgi:hypothetical protein|tara:strand:- start:663 stop:1193 length:531 start_codon:yes stop_codon:yes gene_type:complete